MKNLFLLIAILPFSSIFSYSQNILSDSSAQVVAYWKKGEKKKLNFKKVVEKNNAGGRKIDSTEYNVIAEILEEANDGYTIKWQYDRISSNEVFKLLLQDYPQLSKPLTIIYKTDELGTFKEAVNLKELQSYVHETLDFLEKLIESNKNVKNATNVKEAMMQFKAALSGRTGIENVLMKEIQFFHTFFGAQYSLHQKASANMDLPNAFGGDPFKARIEVDLKEINKKENSITLEMHQFVDREQSKKIIVDIMKKIMPPDVVSDAKTLEKEIANFDMEDVCTQKIHAGSCWLDWMSYKRTVTAGNLSRLETLSLTVR